MKTKELKRKGDWTEVLDDCRNTVGKEELGIVPSDSFKQRILMAEHSPIRAISFRWVWEDIKSWVATHFSRHKWESYIQTQRSDRTGIDRNNLPQGELVKFTGDANVQHLIDTAKKRLCRKASPETRALMEDLKDTLSEREPSIAAVLVPNCVYRGGCPEMGSCELFQENLKTHPELASPDLQQRYDKYNELYKKRRR